MQAGEIIATYDEEIIVHERDFEYDPTASRWDGRVRMSTA
jgi:hypothetical protein